MSIIFICLRINHTTGEETDLKNGFLRELKKIIIIKISLTFLTVMLQKTAGNFDFSINFVTFTKSNQKINSLFK